MPQTEQHIPDEASPVTEYRRIIGSCALCLQEIESQIDRIYEMGEVMRKAVQVDDDQFFTIQEKLAQLEVRPLYSWEFG